MRTNNTVRQLRSTYAEVNLCRLGENVATAKKLSGSDIVAVVKADAYGHGASRTAQYMSESCGVKNFAVATIEEAVSLRQALGEGPRIIVLGYIDPLFYGEVLAYRLLPVIYDSEGARALHGELEKRDESCSVAVKIDTGMGRLGFSPALDLREVLREYPRFYIAHLMSHLSSSDSDPDYTALQQGSFEGYINKYSDIKDFTTSMFNSAAIATRANPFTHTRPGLMLYGYVAGVNEALVKPVMTVYSKIVHVMKLKKGDSVSYNRRFIADKEMWAGVLPIGYADGYPRHLSNTGRVMLEGVNCPVLGTVCMDMTMIDITPLGENAYGKWAQVMGEQVSAAEIAESLGSIPYEFLTGLSARIPRVYTDKEGRG